MVLCVGEGDHTLGIRCWVATNFILSAYCTVEHALGRQNKPIDFSAPNVVGLQGTFSLGKAFLGQELGNNHGNSEGRG